jgi:hypothetical protein
MVCHPDHVMAKDVMQYTNLTRGASKKLFRPWTSLLAKEVAAAQAKALPGQAVQRKSGPNSVVLAPHKRNPCN